MQLAKVIGSMVSTRKCERLQGLKLLVAVPIDMDPFEVHHPFFPRLYFLIIYKRNISHLSVGIVIK